MKLYYFSNECKNKKKILLFKIIKKKILELKINYSH